MERCLVKPPLTAWPAGTREFESLGDVLAVQAGRRSGVRVRSVQTESAGWAAESQGRLRPWPETPKPRRLSARGFALTTWTADFRGYLSGSPRPTYLGTLAGALKSGGLLIVCPARGYRRFGAFDRMPARGAILCQERLGRLLRHYYQKAAWGPGKRPDLEKG